VVLSQLWSKKRGALGRQKRSLTLDAKLLRGKLSIITFGQGTRNQGKVDSGISTKKKKKGGKREILEFPKGGGEL